MIHIKSDKFGYHSFIVCNANGNVVAISPKEYKTKGKCIEAAKQLIKAAKKGSFIDHTISMERPIAAKIGSFNGTTCKQSSNSATL